MTWRYEGDYTRNYVCEECGAKWGYSQRVFGKPCAHNAWCSHALNLFAWRGCGCGKRAREHHHYARRDF